MQVRFGLLRSRTDRVRQQHMLRIAQAEQPADAGTVDRAAHYRTPAFCGSKQRSVLRGRTGVSVAKLNDRLGRRLRPAPAGTVLHVDQIY